MNKKLKGLALAAGVLAGAGSLIPLTTYAVDASPSPTVSVTVPATLTINSVASANITDISASKVGTGNISVTVTSNKGYTISFKAPDSNSTALRASGISDTINAIANGGTSTLTAGSANSWGIKKTSSSAGSYTGITTSAVVFHTATSGATSAKTDFPVGVSITSSLTAGTYSTTITATVANT